MAVRNVREGAFEPCALVHEGTDAFSVVLVKGAAGSQRVRSHFEGLALAKAVNEARLHASTNLSSVSHQEPLPRVGPASEPEVQIAPAMQREPAVEEERCTVAVQPAHFTCRQQCSNARGRRTSAVLNKEMVGTYSIWRENIGAARAAYKT